MSSIVKLAKMLKERDNKSPTSTSTGKVLSWLPNEVIISIENGAVFLRNEHIILTQTVVDRTIEIGDELVIIPTPDEQTYFVLDKAVVLDVSGS
jgi:hypothetical protein